MDQVPDDPLGAKVNAAFRGNQGNWRTVGGIAREAKLPRERVQRYLKKNPQRYVTARISLGGKQLYGIRTESAKVSSEDSPVSPREAAAS